MLDSLILFGQLSLSLPSLLIIHVFAPLAIDPIFSLAYSYKKYLRRLYC